MTISKINDILEELDIPFSYYQFNEGEGDAPPFICWYMAESNDLYADGENFATISGLIIELYTDAKDFALELQLEEILRTNGISWAKSETFIDSEKLHETIYESEVLINAEDE